MFSNVQFTDTGLVFELDIAGTLIANESELGLHWTMTGGNDVIEGLASPFTARHRRQTFHAR